MSQKIFRIDTPEHSASPVDAFLSAASFKELVAALHGTDQLLILNVPLDMSSQTYLHPLQKTLLHVSEVIIVSADDALDHKNLLRQWADYFCVDGLSQNWWFAEQCQKIAAQSRSLTLLIDHAHHVTDNVASYVMRLYQTILYERWPVRIILSGVSGFFEHFEPYLDSDDKAVSVVDLHAMERSIEPVSEVSSKIPILCDVVDRQLPSARSKRSKWRMMLGGGMTLMSVLCLAFYAEHTEISDTPQRHVSLPQRSTDVVSTKSIVSTDHKSLLSQNDLPSHKVHMPMDHPVETPDAALSAWRFFQPAAPVTKWSSIFQLPKHHLLLLKPEKTMAQAVSVPPSAHSVETPDAALSTWRFFQPAAPVTKWSSIFQLPKHHLLLLKPEKTMAQAVSVPPSVHSVETPDAALSAWRFFQPTAPLTKWSSIFQLPKQHRLLFNFNQMIPQKITPLPDQKHALQSSPSVYILPVAPRVEPAEVPADHSNVPTAKSRDRSTVLMPSWRWLLQQPGSTIVVQLMGSNDKAIIDRMIHRYPDLPLVKGKVQRNNRNWYILLWGHFKSLQQAQAATARLPKALIGQNPWVRSLHSIKQEYQRILTE